MKELDAKVKRPANVFSYVFGSISALIMGSGMSLGMITPFGSTLLNVVLCLAGGLLVAVGLGEASNTVLKKTSLV